jgi:hypothetical protein
MSLSGTSSKNNNDGETIGISRRKDGKGGVKVVGLDVDEERKMDVDI